MSDFLDGLGIPAPDPSSQGGFIGPNGERYRDPANAPDVQAPDPTALPPGVEDPTPPARSYENMSGKFKAQMEEFMRKGYSFVTGPDGNVNVFNKAGQHVGGGGGADVVAILRHHDKDFDPKDLTNGGMSFEKDGDGFKASSRGGTSVSGGGGSSGGGSSNTPAPGPAPTAQQPGASVPMPDPINPGGSTPGIFPGSAFEEGLQVSGVSDPGRRGGPSEGVPASLFDFLPENFNQMTGEERMQALIGATIRRNESGMENSLGRLDSANAQRNERAAGTRALEDKILGDTDVMGENEIQRISGQVTSQANQKANLLGNALAERRAAAGSSRSGGAQTEQSAVLQNAMGTAIKAESDIRAGARRENFQSRNAALDNVGRSSRADVGLGADIQGRAAGVIEGSQVYANDFLTQNLLNRDANINRSPQYQTTQAGGKTVRTRLDG